MYDEIDEKDGKMGFLLKRSKFPTIVYFPFPPYFLSLSLFLFL